MKPPLNLFRYTLTSLLVIFYTNPLSVARKLANSAAAAAKPGDSGDRAARPGRCRDVSLEPLTGN